MWRKMGAARGGGLRDQPGLEEDFVGGDLANVVVSGGSVLLPALQCVANDSVATNTDAVPETQNPLSGQVFYYLFRDDASASPADAYGADGQGRPRFAAGSDCPSAR